MGFQTFTQTNSFDLGAASSSIILGLTISLVGIFVLGFLFGLGRKMWVNNVKLSLFIISFVIALFIARPVGDRLMNDPLSDFMFIGSYIPASGTLTLGESTYTIVMSTLHEVATQIIEAYYDYGNVSIATNPELSAYIIELAAGIVRLLTFFTLYLLFIIISIGITLILSIISIITPKIRFRLQIGRRFIGAGLSGLASFLMVVTLILPFSASIHSLNRAYKDPSNLAVEAEGEEAFDPLVTFLNAYNGSIFVYFTFGFLKDKDGRAVDTLIMNYISDGEITSGGEKLSVSLQEELKTLGGIYYAFASAGALNENFQPDFNKLVKEESVKTLFYNLRSSNLMTTMLPIVFQLFYDQTDAINSIKHETIKANFKNDISSLTITEYQQELDAIEQILLTLIKYDALQSLDSIESGKLYNEAAIDDIFAAITSSQILTKSYPVLVDQTLSIPGIEAIFGVEDVTTLRDKAAALDPLHYEGDLLALKNIFKELVRTNALDLNQNFNFNNIYNEQSINTLLTSVGKSNLFVDGFGLIMNAMFNAQGVYNKMDPLMMPLFQADLRGMNKSLSQDEIEVYKHVMSKLFTSGQADLINNKIQQEGATTDAFYNELLDQEKIIGFMDSMRAVDGKAASSENEAIPPSFILNRLIPAQLYYMGQNDNSGFLKALIPSEYSEFPKYEWGSEVAVIFEGLAEIKFIDPRTVNLISGNPQIEAYSWKDLIRDNKAAFSQALIGNYVKPVGDEISPSVDPLTGRSLEYEKNPALLDSDLVVENIEKLLDFLLKDYIESSDPVDKLATIYYRSKTAELDSPDLVQKRLNYKNNMETLIDIFVNSDQLVTVDINTPPSVLPPLPEFISDGWEISEDKIPPWAKDLLP